jgi:hypothetical protein
MEALSSRGRRAVQPALSYFDKQLAGASALYDASTRPDGYILMAVAENRLNYASAAAKLASCRALEASTGAYDNMRGRAGLRQAFAGYLNGHVLKTTSHLSKHTPPSSSSSSSTHGAPEVAAAAAAGGGGGGGGGASSGPAFGGLSSTAFSSAYKSPSSSISSSLHHFAVDAEQLVIGSGCGALIHHLATCLFEAGEGVLLPTPTYGALYNDFGVQAGVKVVDVPTENDGYRLTESALERSFSAADADGTRVRALFLINPNNPLGIVYSEEEMKMCLAWTRSKGIHLIVDEIYAGSVHSSEPHKGPRFTSIVDICVREREKTLAPIAATLTNADAAATEGGEGAAAPGVSSHANIHPEDEADDGPCNSHSEFVGYEKLKAQLAHQTKSFEEWAANNHWRTFHMSHYDWWAFPIPGE